jgi:hypothetical protein
LTFAEQRILYYSALAVLENMQWDETDGVYRENYENWLYSLDKTEYSLLKKAIAKIE